jgi:Cell division protein FtsI/penicillin-binding protein 2
MNTAIRRVGLVIVLLFVAISAQLTYLQLVRSASLNRDPSNVRVATRDLTRDRGNIVTTDGAILARSFPVKDSLKYQRTYPLGALFAHVVGYQSVNQGNTGVEREYDPELLGRDVRLQTHSLADLLNPHNPTGTVVLTLTRSAQQVAKDALRGRRGSVVVLDVQTGGIVAMYSEPSFDPNPLASHNTTAVQKYFNALEAIPIHPDLPRAYRERYPAGSTFKVLTAAVALDAGIVNPATPFPRVTNIPLPQSTKTLSNFGGERCGGTLAESFTVSCNTTFARIGLTLGNRLAQGIAAFGINAPAPPLDLIPSAASSVGPRNGTFRDNQPFFALGAIGQGDVAVTPLEMALVAESVADNGVMMVPHVMSEIRAPDGTVVRRYHPEVWRRTMTPGTALVLNEFMRSVVASPNGTGTAARIPGITVAGKTGTAESPGGHPHAWFIAFAPAEAPRYAIAVIVERGGDQGSEATGGRVAAPVAAQVLRALLTGPTHG